MTTCHVKPIGTDDGSYCVLATGHLGEHFCWSFGSSQLIEKSS